MPQPMIVAVIVIGQRVGSEMFLMWSALRRMRTVGGEVRILQSRASCSRIVYLRVIRYIYTGTPAGANLAPRRRAVDGLGFSGHESG